MFRALMLLIGVGLLSTLVGCRSNCQGRCDCQVYPLEHGTPLPYVKPSANIAPPLQSAP